MCKFRELRANEIECRVQSVTEKGVILLLYKDARADMKLLDETVGAANWQRKHSVVNGNLFCTVSIKLDGEWVSKEDVGVESNTEKEKGQASDAFKRACTNWGIGRELYTSPFIWVGSDKVKVEKNQRGSWNCRERFKVSHIAYNSEREISELVISTGNGNEVYRFGSRPQSQPQRQPQAQATQPQAKPQDNALAKAKADMTASYKAYRSLSGATDDAIMEVLKAGIGKDVKEFTADDYKSAKEMLDTFMEAYQAS